MMDKNSLKRPRLDWQWSLKKHVKDKVAFEVDEESDDNHIIRRWEEMDNDILVSIMKRLSERHLIFSICFVCKSWLNAALDTLFPPRDVFDLCHYGYMYTNYVPYLERFWKMIKLHLNRDQQRHYTKLVLPDIFSRDGYCYIARRLPSVRSVAFRMGRGKVFYFRAFASCWKELVEVECSASCAQVVGMMWNNQIHTLRLDGHVKVEDAIDVARNFPCLTHLSLRYCTLIDNALSLILESHKNLTYLDLSRARLLEKNVFKDWDEDFLLKVSTTITQFVRCEMRRCGRDRCWSCLHTPL